MFDSREYSFEDTLENAKEKRKIKKILFNISKAKFSDISHFQMQYYRCVNECLHNEKIEGKELDKAIVHCKFKLLRVKKYIDDTNQHAKVKVQRCINSKRDWARQLNQDLKSEEKGVWDCLNRYHRRYLYYYPGIKDKQFY